MKFLTDAFYMIKHSLLSGPYGPELVENGSLTDGTNGWVEARGVSNQFVIDGRLQVIADNTGTMGASTEMTGLTIGKSYRFIGNTTRNTTTGTLFVRISPNLGLTAELPESLSFANPTEPNDFEITFTATATTMHVGVLSAGHAAAQYFELDDYSVKEVL